MMAHANVKWSKVLINGVPLQGTGSAPGPAPSAACHASLTAENPSYKALKVTQMPSWVRAPGTYASSNKDKSSLIVAFEDPDGSLVRDLIRAKSLFVFGAQATVRKWKYKAPHPNTRVKRLADARVAARVVTGELQLPDPPGAQAQAPSRPSTAVFVAASAAQTAWRAQQVAAAFSPSVATEGASDRPPTPGSSAAPLVHSPPSAPPGRKAKRSKKKAAA